MSQYTISSLPPVNPKLLANHHCDTFFKTRSPIVSENQIVLSDPHLYVPPILPLSSTFPVNKPHVPILQTL